MNNNIFKCKNESDLNEILNDNAHTLVTIMYVTSQTDPRNKLKKCIFDLSKDNDNCMFIYIDVNAYIGTEHTITKTISVLPTTFIYLNNNSLAVIEGECTTTIKKTFGDILQAVSKKINLSRDDNSVSSINKSNDNNQNKDNDSINITNNTPNIDINQVQLEEQQNNEEKIKLQKVKKIQQMLNIQQLSRLKKLKELEENDEENEDNF